MAWNGSDRKGRRHIPTSSKSRSGDNARMRHLPWGTIVILLVGAIVWWLVTQRDAAPPGDSAVERRGGQIEEVKAAVVVPKIEKEKPVAKMIDSNARPTKSCEIVNGYIKLPSGRIHKITGVITNSVANRRKLKFEIFKRDCNNEIAGYLSMKPGDTIVDVPYRPGRFKADFEASLNEQIEITSDDTPEQAQLKRDVIAARQELKEAMNRGEDIEKIMLDTRKELQSLMRAKMELKHLFYEQKQKCETEQDVEDLFNACNKMLEERGVAPLTYGPITKRNLMRSQQQ